MEPERRRITVEPRERGANRLTGRGEIMGLDFLSVSSDSVSAVKSIMLLSKTKVTVARNPS